MNVGSSSRLTLALVVGLSFLSGESTAQQRAKIPARPTRLEFTRMVAHWARYNDPSFLGFIDEAQPEIVQHGFYGAHFWSLVHTPQFGGYPAHFPKQGIAECSKWFAERNRQLHQRRAKVIGHFNVEFLVGEPKGEKGPRGFFHFYRNLWDEKLLGPKPVDDPMAFLEKGPDGKPIINNSYNIGGMREYWACLRHPAWQRVLKTWVKRGIEQGLDGFIANYFYRHNCLCEHCQRDFRQYMSQRFTPQQLRDTFQIDRLADHKFKELIFWHAPDKSSPLRREMLRWSQISNKRVFDEVFVRYGRSLKPDLIVAQWNHLGSFSQINGDERCLLPADMWGAQEDYLWYSTGAAAYYTDLKKRFLGEGTLQARFIRGAFDDKPFTLGKYENTRIRTAIAELAANGGAPMGFYTRYTDPLARKEIARYYQFLKRYDGLFRANRPHAEAVLLFPRRAVHQGNVEPLKQFREQGRELLDRHILFDVLPDDLASKDRLTKYAHVIRTGDDLKKRWQAIEKNTSRFKAPYTVRVSASRSASGQELTLHFVNYNRNEPQSKNDRPNAGRGIVDEKPIRTTPIPVQFELPDGVTVRAVETATPESPESKPLAFKAPSGKRVVMDVPEFLVYRIVRLHLKK